MGPDWPCVQAKAHGSRQHLLLDFLKSFKFQAPKSLEPSLPTVLQKGKTQMQKHVARLLEYALTTGRRRALAKLVRTDCAASPVDSMQRRYGD